MKEIIAKTILQRMKPSMNGWFWHDYNMNLYRGCSHGCIYCDSRSLCYGDDYFDINKPKKDALKILENELFSKRIKGICGLGGMNDPYNPLEKKLEITRGALKLIHKYGYGVSIHTKSTLVLRDLDILKEINKHKSVLVIFTITTADLKLQKKIEPYASTTLERFEAIKQLNEAGIYAGICLMPILPFINDTDENLDGIVELSKTYNAKFIYAYFGVTLRDRQRDYFYKHLDKNFPYIKEKYIKTYGENYECNSPRSKHLYQRLKDKCTENNIYYKMEDINNAFLKKPKQIALNL